MEKEITVNGSTLKIGQYGEITTFLNEKIQSSKLIQFCGTDIDGCLVFQYDPTGYQRLTVSKNAFPIHIWKSAPNIERKTIIEMYPLPL